MEKLIQSLDYIRGLFNQHTVVNGQYAGRKNTIEVDDDLRQFIDNTLIPVMNVLKQQEDKDSAFEGALQCIQHLAKVVNEQTDNIAIVNVQSFKDGYYGS
jgi:hypothetical protein